MSESGRPEHQADALADIAAANASPLRNDQDLDPLLEAIGDARYVLLGEASHGTAEYYLWRARLTKRLIAEQGFSFVAVEGDWPDCFALNRWVKGLAHQDIDVRALLGRFHRWPRWMWANWEVAAFLDWLRNYNQGSNGPGPVGFYGLDVYSLWESLAAVFDYLERHDPDAVPAAREALLCFDPYGHDEVAYARATALVPEDCEDEVVALLSRLRRQAGAPNTDTEGRFNAERNAEVAVNAERYYRAMVRGGPHSWNIRDQHMADTLDSLMQHHGAQAKGIVWAHNTHVGDARATDMRRAGMFNLGQLVREQHGQQDVALVGMGGYAGSVIAGSGWGAPVERMTVPAAREGSWEDACHRGLGDDGLLLTHGIRQQLALQAHPHRAIGVVYDPARERRGNYVPTVLPERYDAFFYFDETRALHPLQRENEGEHAAPDTYPSGF